MTAKADLLLPTVPARERVSGGPAGYGTGHDWQPQEPNQRLYDTLTYVGSMLQLRSYRLAAELAFADIDADAAIAACRIDGLDDESLENRCQAGFELAGYFANIPLPMIEAVYRIAFNRQSPTVVVDTLSISHCRAAIHMACVRLGI